MNVFPQLNMVSSHWDNIIGVELNVHDLAMVQVINFFQDNEANTPYQLIGRLLIASYPANAEGLDHIGHNNFLRRYRGDGVNIGANVRFQIQRTLFYVVSVCNTMFNLQLPYLDFNEFIEYIDVLPNVQPETAHEPPNAQPEAEILGGNKRKRSAKRKSSKKRTTRSKKRSLK